MSERVYIALDLETTGLNPQNDAIIEIGAISFTCRHTDTLAKPRILDRFVTFVNPNRSIPLRIQQLTGIRDADVANAPTLDKVVPELLAFVPATAAAVVAHNADFDFGFLNAAGIQFHRPTQDTFELASIFFPGMNSYSLGELCRSLGISLPEAHRALDDAEASAHLFCRILNRIHQLPNGVYDILAACGKDAKWPPLLLMEQVQEQAQTLADRISTPQATPNDAVLADSPPHSVAMDGSSSENEAESAGSSAGGSAAHWDTEDLGALDETGAIDSIPAERIDDLLAADGALAQILGAHYEVRQGQMDMALRVLHALNTGDHLIIEAGTGTGKSLAYLAPAALWCARNRRRVVIATNTIALQDQILENDLPLLNQVLAVADETSVRSAILKGRSNYLCMRRLHSWFNNRSLTLTELRVLARILIWLPETRTGDIAELFMPSGPEKLIWTHICSDAKTCHEGRCRPRQRAGHILGIPIRDFFLEARRQAESAHLLVVNHALLLADIAADGHLLPAYTHVVIDEAHRLEDAATDQLSHRVTWKVVFDLLGRIEKSGDLADSAAHALTATQSAHSAPAEGVDRALALIRRLNSQAKSAHERLQNFAAQLLVFFQNLERLRSDLQFAQRISLDNGVRTQPMWVEIELEWDATSQALRTVLETLSALIETLEELDWSKSEPRATYLSDLQSLHGFFAEMVAWVDRIIFEPPGMGDQTTVAWVEVNDAHNNATLVAAPLHVHKLIERRLIHDRRSAIFTGATLRTGSGFTFIRDRLGLWDVTASTVESPFDYQKNALLYLPSDLPEPNQGQYQQAVEQAIMRAAVATGGATLALFTSYAQLRTTADAIRAPLDRQGITVLQHGISSRRRVLREYRDTERAVLLGTRSFWEGIDLPGDELRCLLIVRLPFAVPTDPLVAARSKEFENAFRDYTLPDAIIRFRQGFGRLIRRATDRGVVIVLDSRVWRKEYGQLFLESLPACATRHAPLANLDTEIRQWLDRP